MQKRSVLLNRKQATHFFGVTVFALLIFIFSRWYFTGKYLPIFNTEPSIQQSRILQKNFFGVTQRGINSAVMTCYKFNTIDLDASTTYGTFIASFKNLETYKKFETQGYCPPEVRM